MKIALSTGCLYENPLSDVFKIASAAGFDGIELLVDNLKCNIPVSDLKKLSNKYDVPVISIHSPFVICDGWGNFWERITKSITLAKSLPVQLVNFHPPRGMLYYHRLNNELSRHIEDYKGYIKNSSIVLTIENLPCPEHLRIIPLIDRFFPLLIDNTYQIVEFAIENDIYVTFDTTHIGTTGSDILDSYHIFKERIANIHLSDYDGERQHLLPGKGYLPLKKLLSQLKSDNYSGVMTLETNPVAMDAENISNATRNAKQCLSYIRKAIEDLKIERL